MIYMMHVEMFPQQNAYYHFGSFILVQDQINNLWQLQLFLHMKYTNRVIRSLRDDAAKLLVPVKNNLSIDKKTRARIKWIILFRDVST